MFLSPVPSYEDDDMFLSSRHWLSLNSSCPPQVTFRGWATCCRRSSTWWRMRWMLSGVLSPSWTRWWVWTVTWCNRLCASLLCVQWGINWVRAVLLTGSGVCVCSIRTLRSRCRGWRLSWSSSALCSDCWTWPSGTTLVLQQHKSMLDVWHHVSQIYTLFSPAS